jgi:hypothetical protein
VEYTNKSRTAFYVTLTILICLSVVNGFVFIIIIIILMKIFRFIIVFSLFWFLFYVPYNIRKSRKSFVIIIIIISCFILYLYIYYLNIFLSKNDEFVSFGQNSSKEKNDVFATGCEGCCGGKKFAKY